MALTHGGTDPLGMFPVFLKRTSEVLAPRLAVVFRWLLRLGSFPVCLIVANVTTERIACILCVHLGACRLWIVKYIESVYFDILSIVIWITELLNFQLVFK